MASPNRRQYQQNGVPTGNPALSCQDAFIFSNDLPRVARTTIASFRSARSAPFERGEPYREMGGRATEDRGGVHGSPTGDGRSIRELMTELVPGRTHCPYPPQLDSAERTSVSGVRVRHREH